MIMVVLIKEKMKKNLLNDFNHALKHGDHIVINNRIAQGLEWGWLKQIK